MAGHSGTLLRVTTSRDRSPAQTASHDFVRLAHKRYTSLGPGADFAPAAQSTRGAPDGRASISGAPACGAPTGGATQASAQRRVLAHHHFRQDRGVGADALALAAPLRHRLLRHRVHVDGLVALRHRPLRRRGRALLAAAGRPDDRRRHDRRQDRARAQEDLRPDARAEVRDRDGRLRHLGRLLPRLPRRAGHRRDHPGRHLGAGLPADAGRSDVRHPASCKRRSSAGRSSRG